jgi:drug/metabolite transporter (DMT)-like permease
VPSQTERNGEIPLLKVVLFLAAGMLTFGFAPILVRFTIETDPLALAALRTGFAVAMLLPFWLLKRMPLKVLREKGINQWWLIGAGVSLGAHFSFWIGSLHHTSVASASVLVTMHPVMLIIAESLIFKKNFRPLVWIGVFLAFGGSVLLGLADETQMDQFPNALLGNGMAVTAAAVFVVYFLLGRKIRQHTEWIDYVFYVYLYATITCAALSILSLGGFPEISLTAVWVGIGLAAGPTILGHGAMNYAVKYISPTLLSTLVLSEAVVAAGAAYIIFSEIPSLLSVSSMLVIMLGVAFTWTRRLAGQQNR